MKGDGAVYVTAQDKRVRQLHSGLDALKAAGLVELPHQQRGAGKYERFRLLDETAARTTGQDALPYRVPTKTEPTFVLPDSFVTRGWVHVLADTEIALLCMVACGLHSIDADAVAIPAFHRVQHYGIGRDAFEAHHWLTRFGLLEVTMVDRHEDGRSENFAWDGASLHRLRLSDDGFDDDAVRVVSEAIKIQLSWM